MDTTTRPTTDTTTDTTEFSAEFAALAQRAPIIHHEAVRGPRRLPGELLALPAFAVTLAIALPGIGNRAMWNDEYATWYASTLSPGALLRLLDRVDAVLAPYYVFMHGWIAVFGDSAVSLRVPSALAMATAAGLTTLLGRRLFNGVVGLGAGLLLAGLPAVCRYAQEARPYAMVMASTVLACLLLLRALELPSWRRWWGYAAAMCAVALLHFVALTVLVAHAYFVLRSVHERRDFRVLRWCAAVGVVVTVVLPLAAKGARESSAIDWISADGRALAQLPGKVFGSTEVAVALLAVAALGAVALWRPARERAVLLLVWAVFPAVFCYLTFPLLHLLLFRYLLFTLPACCLLAAAAAAAALGRMRGARWLVPVVTAVLVAAVAFVGLPGQHAARRSPVAGEPDFRASATLVVSKMRPGDGVAYAGTVRNGRRAFAYELRGRPMPRDVFLATDSQRLGAFGAIECKEPGSCAGDIQRIWFVSTAPPNADRFAQMPVATAALLHDEFTAQQQWNLPGVRVVLLLRSGAL
jgi:mannosyltransferase